MSELFVWQKNLVHALRTHPVLVLHGNVRDRYVFLDPPHQYEIALDELLTRLLTPQFGPVRRYDAYSKAADLTVGEAGVFVSTPREDCGAPGFNVTIEPTLSRIVSDVEARSEARIWLLQYAHNLIPFRNSYSQEETLRLIALQRMIENISPGKRLVLCFLSDTQVPIELSQNSHRVAFLKVPMPDFGERRAFWCPKVGGGHSAESARLSDDLSKLTDGMALTSLQTLVEMARAADEKGPQTFRLKEWERIVAQYKFGESRDYYRQLGVDQLAEAHRFFTEEEGIQGQDDAVRRAVRMLWMARTNVASLLHVGSSNPPRGVLFCCGPSGTGKTLLAKKLAKFVFGSEEAFYRIDMSEYQQDHTVSKLIGAPPGYVGYEMGGILTNAVLERPFAVILFDEIEKAHPRVFDLFLQILSDGRLTDSRGQTVFFSEAIIMFTSNLGTRAGEIDALLEAQRSGDPTRVRDHFVRSVRSYFRFEISRPELLNRIGNNIVPFNFLDQQEVLVSAVRYYLEVLRKRFNEEYGNRSLQLQVNVDEVALFLAEQHGDAIREFGGRAVLNTLEDVVLPQLARRLIAHEADPGRGPTTLRVQVGTEEGKRKVCVWLG